MAEDREILKQAVEGGNGIYVIRHSTTHRQWNGIQYKTGLSAKNVPATKLSMNVATIPPGGVAYAHIHVDFDVMLYILQGRVRHEYGPGLKKAVENAKPLLEVKTRRVGGANYQVPIEVPQNRRTSLTR